MKLTYHTASNEEQARYQCCVMLLNHMQCTHKIAKHVEIDDASALPDNYKTNLPSNDYKLTYCQSHFNVLIAGLTKTIGDGDSIVDVDKV